MLNFYIQHLLTYWPVAMVGASTGLIGWLLWVISISISNTRWRKAVENGRYADGKTKEVIREQKVRIIMLEKKVAELKKKNYLFRQALQAVASTNDRIMISLIENEGDKNDLSSM